MKTAVRKGGERVWRETVQALNVSGKAAIKPTGLNRLTAKEGRGLTTTQKNDLIRTRGISAMRGTIKAFRARPVRPAGSPRIRPGEFTKQVAFGGSIGGVDRIYWNDDKKWWTTSSMPGTPPHKQSGRLQKIARQPVNDGYRIRVGPSNGLKYGRIQELGGKTRFGTLPPRPYLEPSFQKMVPAIMQDFRVAIAKATS